MRQRRRVLVASATLALAGGSLQSSDAAAPAVDPGALAHCAGITAADERLACYDSLGRPKSNPAPAATATSAGAKAAAAPAAATAAPAPAPEAKPFGLTRHTPPAEEGPNQIQAKVTGVNTDRLGNVRVSLDNGQLWTFNAPDALLRVGDAVTIKRASLGSFLMTTPSRHTYRTERVQ